MAVNMLNQSGMFIDIGNHEEAQTAVEGAISLFEEIQRDEEGMVSRCSEPNLSEVETPKSAVHSSMNTPNVDPPENAVIAESEKRIINNAVECHLANCYNYLGLIHHHYEEYEEAKAAYKESVLLYERTGEAESLDIANVYNNLGTLMDDMVNNFAVLLATSILAHFFFFCYTFRERRTRLKQFMSRLWWSSSGTTDARIHRFEALLLYSSIDSLFLS